MYNHDDRIQIAFERCLHFKPVENQEGDAENRDVLKLLLKILRI